MSTFISISLLLGLLSLFYAYLFAVASRRNAPWYRSFPRHKWLGMILGTICLLWSAWHAIIMLEGDLQRFHIWVKLLVPVTVVLCYFFLDYLNARALGGLMILATNYLLHAAFVHAVPGRAFYSIICLFLGILGLFLVGTPWRMRQLLERAADNTRWATGLGIAFAICAASLLFQPFLS
jgi:hypothetical protein